MRGRAGSGGGGGGGGMWRALVLLALAAGAAGAARPDDDFAFDNVDEFQVELTANHSEIKKNGLRRLWGVQDATAYTGHLFRMEIPKEAFSGVVHSYKVRRRGGGALPAWLALDARHGLLSGVPQAADAGTLPLTVTARGRTAGLTADEDFVIEVKPASARPASRYGACAGARLRLAVLLDAAFDRLAPRQRARALMELAGFMNLNADEFSMQPYKAESSRDVTVLLSGAGTALRRRGDAATVIYLDLPLASEGSGDYGDEYDADGDYGDYSGDGDDGDDDTVRADTDGEYVDVETPTSAHPHRHHHGEDPTGPTTPTTPLTTPTTADPPTTDDPTETPTTTEDDVKIKIEELPELSATNRSETRAPPPRPSAPPAPRPSPRPSARPAPRRYSDDTPGEPETQTVIIRPSNEYPPSPSTEPTTVASPPPPASTIPVVLTTHTTTTTTLAVPVTTTPTPPTTEVTEVAEVTTTEEPEPEVTIQVQETELSTQRTSQIFGQTTEVLTTSMFVNQPPRLRGDMMKLALTAGKAFRYIIPADRFQDPEDGANLTYSLWEGEGAPLPPAAWIQFIAADREVYGLPLESHVSRWNYIVEARDSGGAAARGPLDITVQQHRSGRTVNHQFTLTFKLTRPFKHPIDWQIRALEAIMNLFRDTDMDHLTVLNATQSGDLCEFVWTNDTLSRDEGCPRLEIQRLMEQMESSPGAGVPSRALAAAAAPELDVRGVAWRGVGECEADEEAEVSTARAGGRGAARENQPPALQHHMMKLAITAGKAFSYTIPADRFKDPEDGANLTYSLWEGEGAPLPPAAWIQFIAADREVYGLPLESHVSRWNYIVEARDSSGAAARGPLDITVQQHRSGRTVNHQFTLTFKLTRPFKHPIDWQIRALKGIVNLFRDTDMHHLTVLNATQNGDLCEFVWTNDTLPRDPECPREDIERLMKIMESSSTPGAASAGLARAMSPELGVRGVAWRGVGKCESAAPTRKPDAFPPVTRNQVDLVTATVGQLLVYRVPEDTFYDPEDLGTRNLRLSLRRADRTPLAAGWLQFDSRNQEFYGLPGPGDIGQQQYQLVAEDSSKKTAYDSLVVEVVRAPTIRPTVEFQMTLEYPFEQLAHGANRRRVVEKLAALFGDAGTDAIRIQNITDSPTTIIWYNTSLPMDRCPEKEIEELRKAIIVDERTLRDNVDQIFDKDLKVMSIRLILLGLCADQNTKTPKTTHPMQGVNVNLHNKASATPDAQYTEYLVTVVIPAAVIVCMIVLAALIACVLYRRRKTGKMSVGDEEERQAFRSKGIPVIFQDELEEQGAEPLHKSPVIMREEKPPLLPPTPDYRTAPYRPPPPVAAAAAAARPKATPTYRKPPPYVPP